MKMNRRNLLTGSAAAATFPLLAGQVFAQEHAHEHADHEHAEEHGHGTMPKSAVILTARVKAKEGEEDKVKEVLASLVGPTRKEKGCIHYILHQDAKDKTMFMFYEVWTNRDALKQHGQTPHMKSLGPKLKGLTGPGGGVSFYDLVK